MAYSTSTGAKSWDRRFNSGPDNAVAYAVIVSPGGSKMFVSGVSDGPGGPSDMVTVAYSA